MKKLLFLAALATGLFTSCQPDPARLSVENRIPGAVVQNVYWGDLLMADQLIPGEESRTFELDRQDIRVDLPETNTVRFYLNSNGATVYLETTATWSLDLEDELTIILDENTTISNPLLDGI